MPRPRRQRPSRARQTWLQWTRQAIQEAQRDSDVSRQCEEACAIFAGIFDVAEPP
jgi:hypothetical protein